MYHQTYSLEELSPSLRHWVLGVFHGIENWFTLPERFSMRWVRLIHQWKLYDTQRQRFEVKHGRILAKGLERVAEVVADTWASRSIELTLSRTQKESVPIFAAWIKDAYRDTEQYFVQRAQNSIREEKGFETIDPFEIPELEAWTSYITASKIVKLDDATRGLVNKLLVDIIRDNVSLYDAQQMLRDNFAFSKVRAYRIARTEVIGAANAATHYGVLNGVGHSIADRMTKTWLATNDRRTRPTHVIAGANQKDVPYNAPFEVGGSLLMFPGDGSRGAAAKEVIQCRCTALYSMPPLPRRRR